MYPSLRGGLPNVYVPIRLPIAGICGYPHKKSRECARCQAPHCLIEAIPVDHFILGAEFAKTSDALGWNRS